jgi:DhnA family fructose-bisphosphate aldolase class Ia
VQDALRLGCCAVGFTIYPGSAHQLEMYEQLRAYAGGKAQRARSRHLVISARIGSEQGRRIRD